MSDRNPRHHGDQSSESSDEYRPFNDPTHPSWYTDPSAPAAPSAPVPGQGSAARNPYADQPLAGPYGNGQAQYPIHGQYPVVTNPAGQNGQNGQNAQPGAGNPYGLPGSASPWDPSDRQAGRPYPAGGQGAPASGLAIAAMVLGIVGVVTGGMLFIPQILAIILGHLSMRRDRQSRAFAIAGLVMGYLVTGLWVLGIVGFMGLLFAL